MIGAEIERTVESYDPTRRWVEVIFVQEPPRKIIRKAARRYADYVFEGARAKNSKFIHMGTITLVEFSVIGDRQLSESDKLPQREENLRSEIRDHVLRVDSPHESWLTNSGVSLYSGGSFDA